MNKIFLILFIAGLFAHVVKSQIPINDPTSWILQPSGTSGGTEDFNAALNTSKWFIYNNSPSYWGAEYQYSTNLDMSSGTSLKIHTDTLIPGVWVHPSSWATTPSVGVTYVYQSGAIQSNLLSGDHVYKFGYLEALIKFPTAGYYPLWPAFWLYSIDCSIPFIDEIDIAENDAHASNLGTIMGTNVHLYNPAGSCHSYYTNSNGQDIHGLPVAAAWHKYAIQWDHDRIIWYFDDAPVRSIYDASGTTVPQYGMDVVFDFAISPWESFLPSDWTANSHGNGSPTSWPKVLEVDYLKYYKLGVDCSTNQIVCTPSDYNRTVKKTIVTNNACNPTYNPTTFGASYTLRATDYVILDAGTEINPTGSGFFAIETMPCPQ